jgi:hypothetical protein
MPVRFAFLFIVAWIAALPVRGTHILGGQLFIRTSLMPS